MNVLNWYAQRVGGRKDTEHRQALLRLAIVLVGVAYWLYAILVEGNFASAWPGIVGTIVVSAAILTDILRRPEASPIRRVAGAIHDNFFTAYFMFYLGPHSALFLFIFPFVTVGNGFRFGARYLGISGLLNAIAIASFVYLSAAWKDQWLIGTGILLSNVVVAAYTGLLLQRLSRTEEQLRRMATHDSLTGLGNRHLFLEHLGRTCAANMRQKQSFACLYFDLDGFKQVNDVYGHKFGDKLLKVVADTVRGSLRKNDLVARMGGDEFTLVLDHLKNPADAKMVANRIIKSIERIKTIDSHEIRVSASVGIAFVPQNTLQTFIVPDDLIREADEAMYRAKRAGKGRLEFANVDEIAAASFVFKQAN